MLSIAIIVQDGFAPFEFGLACEVFGIDRPEEGIPKFDTRVVAAEPGAIRSSLGYSITTEDDLTFADEADVLIVLPALRETWGSVDPRTAATIRRAVDRGAWVLSLCTGAFTLAAAGVLDGRQATTHWMYSDALSAMYPGIDVDPDVLYVQDGRVITSAGTAAGIDACLHLLRQELGVELTTRLARRMVVSPQRDGGQAQFIDKPIAAAPSLSFAAVTDWMLHNIREDLTVDQLASKAHMSPRTFARRFKEDLGTTPAQWLAKQRLLHAQRLLEQTDYDLEQIAAESGFGSAAVLRQNFARRLGTTPTSYRGRFNCTTEVTIPA